MKNYQPSLSQLCTTRFLGLAGVMFCCLFLTLGCGSDSSGDQSDTKTSGDISLNPLVQLTITVTQNPPFLGSGANVTAIADAKAFGSTNPSNALNLKPGSNGKSSCHIASPDPASHVPLIITCGVAVHAGATLTLQADGGDPGVLVDLDLCSPQLGESRPLKADLSCSMTFSSPTVHIGIGEGGSIDITPATPDAWVSTPPTGLLKPCPKPDATVECYSFAFKPHAQVTLTAISDQGEQFSNWTSGCNLDTNPSVTFTMDRSRFCGAVFNTATGASLLILIDGPASSAALANDQSGKPIPLHCYDQGPGATVPRACTSINPIASGTTLTLSATNLGQFATLQWGGSCTGTGGTTATVSTLGTQPLTCTVSVTP